MSEVLIYLDRHGLKVKKVKCAFGKRYVEYLGHIVGDGKLAIPEHPASAMLDFKLSNTKKQLRSFLGGMSYYRRFIPHYVSYSSILSPATSKKVESVVRWTEEMLTAFKDLKGTMVQVCVLTIPMHMDVLYYIQMLQEMD